MPCYDPRDSEEVRISNARAEFRHNSDVAEMLCAVLQTMDACEIAHLSLNTQQWWIEHQLRDAARPTP